MKKILLSFALTLLAACAHPSYPESCDAGWFSNNGQNVGYWRAYTLPNTRDGMKTGSDIGGVYGLLPVIDFITEPVGAIVGGAVGLVGDALNMTVGALSVVIVNPLKCSENVPAPNTGAAAAAD